MIGVDKGLPIPRRRRGGKLKYPWLELEVGDSFFVAGEDRVSSQTSIASKKYNRKFVSRKVPEGTRIWRVE